MSSIKYVFLALLLAAPSAGRPFPQADPQPVTCPAVLESTDAASAPAGFIAENATGSRPLVRLSVLQKNAAGQEFDLAPDNTTHRAHIYHQSWQLAHDPALKTYLRCRYKNTDTTLLTELGAEIRTCDFQFRAAANGAVLAPISIHCF